MISIMWPSKKKKLVSHHRVLDSRKKKQKTKKKLKSLSNDIKAKLNFF